jgi:serine/threonine protein kinase
MEQLSRNLQTLADFRRRLPKNRRKSALYKNLDSLAPGWEDLVNQHAFADWAAVPDSENGTCMLDRIRLLLDDPVFAAADLAIILRIFRRWNHVHGGNVGSPAIRPNHGRRGKLSGKYELIHRLGRGGNGEVSLVWSTETEKFYALKTIRSELAADTIIRQSFRNEALAWISLGEHPNVAKAYFFEEIGPHLYVTMEFVDGDDDGLGPSLADKLAVGPISTEKLFIWFCQIADGLNHGYSGGIRAHRDIKPGNILINRENIAQVSDFGLAVTMEALVAGGPNEGRAVGTPAFMPPEQFDGSSTCNQASDVYSLGVTLYQAATGGELPFQPQFSPQTSADMRRYIDAIRRLHENAHPKPIRSILWPIISKCLSKRPSDRFHDLNSFRSELASLAARHQISVPAPAKAGNDFWVLRDQGNTFMRLGRYEDAIKAFDSFLAIVPDGSAAFNRAVCFENLGRFEEALKTYEYCARNNDIRGLVNIGNCLRKLGRKEEAVNYARRAIELKPNDVACWIAMGNAVFALEKWQEAMSAYATAHELDPANPTPSYNFGLAALRAGLAEQAKPSVSFSCNTHE